MNDTLSEARAILRRMTVLASSGAAVPPDPEINTEIVLLNAELDRIATESGFHFPF